MHIFKFFWVFIKPFLFLMALALIGSSGFIMIENWRFLDALYMTVITITTVGFGEVKQLSDNGKIFTIILIIGGVLFYGAGLNALLRIFLEKSFKKIVEDARMKEKINKLKDHYIICGGGRMALSIVNELQRSNKPFIVLETNPESPVSKSTLPWIVLNRDALLEESLIEARIEHAKGLAAVLPTDADNLFVVLSARRLNSNIRIETRIAKESSRDKMLQAGANKVVSPYTVGGLQIARSFINPMVDDFLEVVLDHANYEFAMKVVKVQEGDELVNKKIRDTDFREKGYIIIGVRHANGQLKFAPESDCQFEAGCEVLILGSAREPVLD
ncbi:MAG: potassium channel protein [Spirochaetia bacterium]|nr:potassium channel protein [Spirochaetia bacterium]